MTLEKIFSEKHRFAVILRDGHEPDGTMFYTDKEEKSKEFIEEVNAAADFASSSKPTL